MRVHPSPEYRENFPIIELKDEREEYIVTSALVPELTGELVTKTLFLAINRQGTVLFWPVRLPTADGKDLDWWRSGREAAGVAMHDWVRLKANMNLRRVRHLQSRERDHRAPVAATWVLGSGQACVSRSPDHHR